MKTIQKILTILLLITFTQAFSQTVTYNENYDRVIIESEKMILTVEFLTEDQREDFNYEVTKKWKVARNKIIIPMKYLYHNTDRVVVVTKDGEYVVLDLDIDDDLTINKPK